MGDSSRPTEAIAAIAQMARENPGWGAKRIVRELGKLGISVCKPTVQRSLRQVRPRGPRAGQSWATFVRNHLDVTWACDFFSVPVGVCSQLYVSFVLDLGTRRVLHWNVTANPTDEWLAHQAREVTAWGQGPRFLIRDRDGKLGARFDAVFQSTGARVLHTPPRTPVANCFAERWVGTARRLLLDHLIVPGEAHLRVHMARLVAHYDGQRPHQGLGQRIPDEVRAPRGRATAAAPGFATALGVCPHHDPMLTWSAARRQQGSPRAAPTGDGPLSIVRGSAYRAAAAPDRAAAPRPRCTISCGRPHTAI